MQKQKPPHILFILYFRKNPDTWQNRLVLAKYLGVLLPFTISLEVRLQSYNYCWPVRSSDQCR